MKTERDLSVQQVQQLPSKRELAKATGIALLVAMVLLLTVVLPAEYGVDPLGTGAALGLTKLATEEPLPEAAAAGDIAKLTPVQEGPVAHYSGEYKFDSTELKLGPYDYVEYKYRLEKGASLQYAWTADSDLLHDFHGEPEGGQPNSEQSFDKRERHQAYGTLIAPFSGIHGWYWENPGGGNVTVKLKTAGFYSSAVEIHSDRTRRNREVTPLKDVTISVKTGASSAP